MPQFDTFTYFSQVTWVFFLFGIVYIAISYSLSPITATILKVRKLKFLDIKRSSFLSNEKSSKPENGFVQHDSNFDMIPLNLQKFKLNFGGNKFDWNTFTSETFFSNNFIIESLFLKNKFRYSLLRSIFTA